LTRRRAPPVSAIPPATARGAPTRRPMRGASTAPARLDRPPVAKTSPRTPGGDPRARGTKSRKAGGEREVAGDEEQEEGAEGAERERDGRVRQHDAAEQLVARERPGAACG